MSPPRQFPDHHHLSPGHWESLLSCLHCLWPLQTAIHPSNSCLQTDIILSFLLKNRHCLSAASKSKAKILGMAVKIPTDPSGPIFYLVSFYVLLLLAHHKIYHLWTLCHLHPKYLPPQSLISDWALHITMTKILPILQGLAQNHASSEPPHWN